MREITPVSPLNSERHALHNVVKRSAPQPVNSYPELVEAAARLAYLNKDSLLFFRGQDQDYKNKAGSSSFYPSIYRKDLLTAREVRQRFDTLDRSVRKLAQKFAENRLDGKADVRRRKHVAWGILQHYGACETPLLDLTQSLRAACTFAQRENQAERGLVAVFGLPYFTNRITCNSEHDLVIVRLLSICPPLAVRPYFQEGYLAGTLDVSDDYDNKQDLDFNNRLLAKFSIPNDRSFWGSEFNGIPEDLLFPKDDGMAVICDEVRREVERETISVFMSDGPVS